MTQIHRGRFTADTDEPFVVFLIGMRFNRPLAIAKWLPVATAMPRMLKELSQDPDAGLLHYQINFYWPGLFTTQYWRSFDHLERFAKDAARTHRPAWHAFNRNIGSDGSVGIWHESYLVRPGGYESIYVNMPRFGLAVATQHVSVSEKNDAARQRLQGAAARG